MKTRSIRQTQPNGAKTELGVVEHEGREYAALGSIVDHNEGYALGYVSADERTLTTWDGQTISTLRRTGTARGFHGSEIRCYRATIDGIAYHGRSGFGPGGCLRLKRCR